MGCGSIIRSPLTGIFLYLDMKKILLLLFPVLMLAQHPADADVKKLYTAFHDIDIDFLSERICSPYEGMDLYARLDDYFLNDSQKFRYVFTNAKYNYEAALSINGLDYYPVNFRNVIRITYFQPIDVAATQEQLKAKFAAQSIVYERARNSFLIVYQAKILTWNAQGIWKFAILDQTIPQEITNGCLPQDVRSRLGLP